MTAFDYFSNAHPELASLQQNILRLLPLVREHHSVISRRLDANYTERCYERTWQLLALERRLLSILHNIDSQYESFANALVGK